MTPASSDRSIPPASKPADRWRNDLRPYGEPVLREPPAPTVHTVVVAPPRRASAAGWWLALGLGAALAVAAVASLQDPRTLGAQLDAAVGRVRSAGDQLGRAVSGSQDAAAQRSRQALAGVTAALDDSAISLKVKTALAADPALSAARIEVTTAQGVVRLEGPAPDMAARERATVLAGAPQGVRGVDNRLALPQPGNVVAVADGVPRPAASIPR